MKKIIILTVFFTLFVLKLSAESPIFNKSKSNRIEFVENKGQFYSKSNSDKLPSFVAFSNHFHIYLFEDRIGFNLIIPKKVSQFSSQIFNQGSIEKDIVCYESLRNDMVFIGANTASNFKPSIIAESTTNYYNERFPNGLLGVRQFKTITKANLYPNTDIIYYQNQKGEFQYDLKLKPGADLSKIKMKFEFGAISIDEQGNLVCLTYLGKIIQSKPIAIQDNIELESSFILDEKNQIGFEVKGYNPEKELTIDPVSKAWSSYYGGEGDDFLYDVKATNSSTFICGTTTSFTQIASLGYQNDFGGAEDAILAKFSSDGNRIWATYYGGSATDSTSGYDVAYKMALDKSGNPIIVGETGSYKTMASSGAFLETLQSDLDGFVAKFQSSDGARLWGTYLGGKNDDKCNGICVDSNDQIYVCGYTQSDDNIYFDGYQLSRKGNNDAFLVKFKSNGDRVWGTYYGGSGSDISTSAAYSKYDNSIFMIGTTESTSLISTSGSHQETFGGLYDAFLVKFKTAGDRLVATYYGGEEKDFGNEVIYCQSDSSINICGTTLSTTNIYSKGQQFSLGGFYDAYIAKFNTNLVRSAATYYGGINNELGYSIACDSLSNIYLAGSTRSPNSINNSGFQTDINGNSDGFIVKLDKNFYRDYGTYFGGESEDELRSISFAGSENYYVCGNTKSLSGISVNGFQNQLNAKTDGYFAKISNKGIAVNQISNDASGIYCSSNFISFRVSTNVSTFDQTNLFSVELSNKEGDFSKPIILTKFAKINVDSISVFLPDSLIQGTNYKIRVSSSNPQIIGTPNQISVAGKLPIFDNLPFICANSSIDININALGNCKYTWTVSNGTISKNIGDTSLSIQWNQTGIAKITIKRDILGVCSNTYDYSKSISPNPIGNFTSKDTICIDSNSILSVITNKKYFINWMYGGVIFDSGFDKTITSIKFKANQNDLLQVQLIDTLTACNIIISKKIIFYYPPIANISGINNSCLQCIERYYASDSTGLKNKWMAIGGILLSSDSGNYIDVKWNTTPKGSIRLSQTNKIGCIGINSLDVNISNKLISYIKGSNVTCKNNITYFTTSQDPNNMNKWTLKSGKIIDSSQNRIGVVWDKIVKDTIKLVQKNNFTAQTDSTYLPIEVINNLNFKIMGKDTICLYNPELFSINLNNDSLRLNKVIWNYNGRSDTTIADFPLTMLPSKSGIMKLKAIIEYSNLSNQIRCPDTLERSILTVQINKPVLALSGDTIRVLNFDSQFIINWFFDGISLNVKDSLITDLVKGNYYATYSFISGNKIYCQTDTSNNIFYKTSGVEDNIQKEGFQIFPNPSTGICNIELNSSLLNEKLTINVTDIYGRVVYDGKSKNDKITVELNLSYLSSGIYFIEIENGTNKFIKKIQIIK